MRVVHYLNQFFGGLGGEDHANAAPQTQDTAVGPGRLLEQMLGEDYQVVRTIVCGDNYAAENLDRLTAMVINEAGKAGAELFVAGPCFEAGRYGVAAGALCSAVSAELGIPAVTGMALENPGVDLYHQDLYIVDSGQNAADMGDVIGKMVRIAQKLIRNEEINLPSEEGYIARGILRDAFVDQTAAERLVEMLFAKTAGEPFESELPAPTFTSTPAPPAVVDMSKAKVAVVTDGGLVPKGNPDKISAYAATNWGSYDITGASGLEGEDYEISHRGYDTRYVEQDPDRLVPLDVLRDLEAKQVVGEVHNQFIATSGLANPLANSRRLGREIAQNLKESGVDAVILTST